MILLGFSYSLVPAAMWPSVPKVVPEKLLGTAYALIYWVQNLGLWGFKRMAGNIMEAPAESLPVPSFSTQVNAELMFVCLCVAALLLSWLLVRSSRAKPDLGLDKPSVRR